MLLPISRGETLEAGRIVEVRLADLPDDVEEFELLLAAGSGGRVVLRLTESRDPGIRSVRWTVPNLAIPEARIRLRINRDGREIEAAASDPFAIAQSPGAAAAALVVRAGEVWVGEEEREEDGGEPLSFPAMRKDPDRLERAGAGAPLLPPRTPPDLFDPLATAPGRAAGGSSPPSRVRVPALSRAPLSVPPRI